jgi:hypothetical protein
LHPLEPPAFDWPNFTQTRKINPPRCAEFRSKGAKKIFQVLSTEALLFFEIERDWPNDARSGCAARRVRIRE